MPTCEDIRKEFNVGLETASKIKKMAVDVPVTTEEYWADLAEKAAPRFPKAKGLQDYVSALREKKKKTKKGQKRQKQSTQQEASNEDNTEPPDVNISEILQTLKNTENDDDTSHFIQNAKFIRMLSIRIASHILTLTTPDSDGKTDEKNFHEASQYIRPMKELSAELRQTETKLTEIRKERAELLARKDVLEMTSEIAVAFRGATDKIIGRLVEIENLPAWLHEVGGYLPDSREARQRLQEKIRGLITEDCNELAQSLEMGTLLTEDLNKNVRDECREEMAQNLEKIIERLREK